LLSLALNKTIEQYSDEEIKQQIREQANIILDSVNKIKDIDAGNDLPDTGDDLPDTGDDLPDTGDDLPDTGDDLPDDGNDDVNYRMIKPLSVHYDMYYDMNYDIIKEELKNSISKIESVALKLNEQNELKWQQHRDDGKKNNKIYSVSSNDGGEKSTDKGNSQGKGSSGDKGNKDKGNSQGKGSSGDKGNKDKGNSQGEGSSGNKGNKKA